MLFVPFTYAEPAPLKLETKFRDASKKYLRKAHEPIKHTLSQDELRFVLLEASITNSKIKWVLEHEGDGYMVFRWDYDGFGKKPSYILTRVEFNNNLLQMKYAGAVGEYGCQRLDDGICYRNKKDYYAFMGRLKKSILRSIKLFKEG